MKVSENKSAMKGVKRGKQPNEGKCRMGCGKKKLHKTQMTRYPKKRRTVVKNASPGKKYKKDSVRWRDGWG